MGRQGRIVRVVIRTLAVAVLVVVVAVALLKFRSRVPELDACRSVAVASPSHVSPPFPQSPPVGVPKGAQPAFVQRVVDGDGLCVRVDMPGGRLSEGQTYEIRILEINAPGKGRCWSKQATAFARREVGKGTTVYLVPDKQDKDRYGRFLRYVWDAEGEFFNEKAVRQGYARVLVKTPNDLYAERIRNAEDEARSAGRGVWGACFPGKLFSWLR